MRATLINRNNMMDRISIWEALTKRNEIEPFLNPMVTGNEQWVTDDNVVRKAIVFKALKRCPKQDQRLGRFCCAFEGTGQESFGILWANAKFGFLLPPAGPFEAID